MADQEWQEYKARTNVSVRAIEAVLEKATGDIDRLAPRVFALLERMAVQPDYERTIQTVRRRWETDLQWQERIINLKPNPRMVRHMVMDWVVKGYLAGAKQREKLGKSLGYTPPSFLLLDPTEACNLRCKGCWAGNYEIRTLPFELVDRVCREAKEMGIHWFVLSGGEPFAYAHLFDILAKHQDIMFLSFTNGTLIDKRAADNLANLGNMSPCFSLEGFQEATDARRGEGVFDQVMQAMDLLRERGLIYGTSLTATRNNVEELFSDAFIDHLIDKGVMYVWVFHYVPIGRDPDLSMMITPAQREWLYHRVRELRDKKPIFIADFWNDGEYVSGCIAGRQYAHINAKGDVEPCAFVHFALDNIHDTSLAEALGSPLFEGYRSRQPFHPNLLTPCPIVDHPCALRSIVSESGAHITHEGADGILAEDVSQFLDERAAEWLERAEKLDSTRKPQPVSVPFVSE